MEYFIIPFDKTHNRQAFDCGVPILNRYLYERAGQDVQKYYSTLFVAVEGITNNVLGYYTLSNTSVNLTDIPDALKKSLPKYAEVPAIRLGRLAVDKALHTKGLGSALLANAILRSMSNVSAWAIMVVDAKDEKACQFYKKCGFAELLDDKKRLYIMRKELDMFVLQNKYKKHEENLK